MSKIKSLTDRQRKLCEEYIPLALSAAGKFLRTKRLPSRIIPDDVYSGAYFGLVNASRMFDESKGNKFTTYAWPAIFSGIYRELYDSDHLKENQRKMVKAGSMREISFCPIEEAQSEIIFENHVDRDLINRNLITYLSKNLTDFEREVVSLRYIFDLGVIEIKRIKRSTKGKVEWALRQGRDKIIKQSARSNSEKSNHV